jgi:hypothetical protein
MKKLVFVFFVALVSILLTNCGDNYNYDPNSSSTIIDTKYYTIYRNEWTPADDFGHYFIQLRNREIDINALENGAVLVYYQTEIDTWVLLPYSTTFWNKDGDLFTEEIWFGAALGTIDIDYVYNDLLDPTPRPELEIKVVVIKNY